MENVLIYKTVEANGLIKSGPVQNPDNSQPLGIWACPDFGSPLYKIYVLDPHCTKFM